MTKRKVQQSPIFQGVDERIAYELDTTPWGGYDSGAANVLKDKDGEDVSLTKLVGAPSVIGDVITTSVVIGLENKTKYRFEILWVKDGNTLETYCEIIGEI